MYRTHYTKYVVMKNHGIVSAWFGLA